MEGLASVGSPFLSSRIISLILKHIFTPLNNTRLSHLCGPTDEHLRTIERELEVKIAHRHEQFKVCLLYTSPSPRD